MSNKDLKQTVEAMRALSARVTASPETALAFLVDAGVVTTSGELTEEYKQSA